MEDPCGPSPISRSALLKWADAGGLQAQALAQLFINASSVGIQMVSGVAGSLMGVAGVFRAAGSMVSPRGMAPDPRKH